MLRIVEEAARTDTGRQRHANEDSYFARSPVLRRRRRHGRCAGGRGRLADRGGRRSTRSIGDGDARAGARAGAPARRTAASSSSRARTRAAAGWARRSPARCLGDEVSIVHVGDSRAYLFRDGELRQLTRDHSLVEELRRQGQLTREEAEEHPQRSIITRALGPEPDVELDVHTHQARSGDVFLLCSDGLTSMVREDRVREILADERQPSSEAADRLVRGGQRDGRPRQHHGGLLPARRRGRPVGADAPTTRTDRRHG